MIIVGGANSAGQAAVFFSRHAAKVTLAVRGDSLERSMSSYLIEQIRRIDNIEVRLNTSVLKCDGNDHLQCVTLVDNATAASRWSTPAHLFVFIGAAPLTDWLPADAGPRPRRLRGDRARADRRRASGRTAGTWTATRTCWSPASPGSSWPATSGRSRSSGSPPRSARARWRSPWCTATWPSSEEV